MSNRRTPVPGRASLAVAARSRVRPALRIVLAVSTITLAAGCGQPGVTSNRLQDAVGLSFSRLFVLQQSELGHAVAPPDRFASCARNGSGSLTGAGGWTCIVHFPAGDGHIEALAFDVEVQPAGCYTAAGPASVVGPQQLQTASGRTVTNPLFAFDGCLRTG